MYERLYLDNKNENAERHLLIYGFCFLIMRNRDDWRVEKGFCLWSIQESREKTSLLGHDIRIWTCVPVIISLQIHLS